jgi:hypothetical protein
MVMVNDGGDDRGVGSLGKTNKQKTEKQTPLCIDIFFSARNHNARSYLHTPCVDGHGLHSVVPCGFENRVVGLVG